MNTKPLLSAALVLALAACNNDQATAPAAVAPASKTPAAEAIEKPLPPGQDKARYVAFENVGACVEAGWPQSQCERSWGTADAMARIDAPAYPQQMACEKMWKFCEQVAGGAEGPRWTPRMIAFAISGEEKGEAGPTADNPAFYVPIFATRDGRLVHVTGTPENPLMTAIDQSKVVAAKRAPVENNVKPISP